MKIYLKCFLQTSRKKWAGMISVGIFKSGGLGGKWESILDVCLSVHRCIYLEKKNQVDAIEWFIALIICSTCFGHFCAYQQEFDIICVLLSPMVCDALVAGCWRSGAGQPAMRSG